MTSTTDHVEDVNRYMGSVNFSPIEIVESSFETEEGVSFDASKFGTSCPEKKTTTVLVVKMLKKIIDLSNLNLFCNTDGLLSKKDRVTKTASSGLAKLKRESQRIN